MKNDSLEVPSKIIFSALTEAGIGQRLGISFVESQKESVVVQIRGHGAVEIAQSPLGMMAISGVVWDCGLLMVDYLHTQQHAPLGRTLDLGCGTGVAGIAARLLGAESVCFSDTLQAEPCLLENLQQNEAFVPFHWSDAEVPAALLQQSPEDSTPLVWDTLLLSDVLYEAKSHEPLMRVLQNLRFRRMAIAYKRRHDDAERRFFEQLETWCICRVVPTNAITLHNITHAQATAGLYIIEASPKVYLGAKGYRT